MISRAYIYCGRPKSSSNKVAEFRLLHKHRQHSTIMEAMHQRGDDECQLFKLPHRRHTPTKMSWMGEESLSLVERNEVRNSTADEDTQTRAHKYKSTSLLFPANAFIDPRDILPSPVHRPPPSTTPSSSEAAISVGADSDECRPLEKRSVPAREKKVTFVLDNTNPAPPSKKSTLTAQIRRQHFRSSHSKGSKNTVNSSTDTLGGVQTNPTVLPKTSDCVLKAPEEGVQSAVVPAAPKPAEKRIVGITSNAIDRPKQQMIKRKLKSCRSRSFHKSLDSSIVAQQNTRTSLTSYKKPLKAVHPEVVTMISLVGLHSEEAEQNNAKAVNVASEIEESARKEPGKDDREGERKSLPSLSAGAKTFDLSAPTGGIMENLNSGCADDNNGGMIKLNESAIEGGAFNLQLNLDQRRNLFASSKNSKFSSEVSKVPASIEQDFSLKINPRRTKSLDGENFEPRFVRHGNQSFSQCVPPQSTKEKECWSSFHRMSEKGLFVSLDTILRGLLTPTEYRLRKDDLGFLGPGE